MALKVVIGLFAAALASLVAFAVTAAAPDWRGPNMGDDLHTCTDKATPEGCLAPSRVNNAFYVSHPEQSMDPTYASLRDLAFAWHDTRLPSGTPAGFILETGFPEGAMTLVVTSDRSISLYYSNGGGTIGAGGHAGPAQKAALLLDLAGQSAQRLEVTTSHPIPSKGEVRMYVLSNDAIRGVVGLEEDFGEGRSPFSPLFYAAHAVISEILAIP